MLPQCSSRTDIPTAAHSTVPLCSVPTSSLPPIANSTRSPFGAPPTPTSQQCWQLVCSRVVDGVQLLKAELPTAQLSMAHLPMAHTVFAGDPSTWPLQQGRQPSTVMLPMSASSQDMPPQIAARCCELAPSKAKHLFC